jgi:putative sterol carrier protein
LSELTARELIETLPDDFRPERAGRANAVVQFRISGEGGGNWYVTFKDKTCTLTEGMTDKPKATLNMAADDYVALATGQLSSMKAFATKKVRVTGDLSLIQRMDRWFVRKKLGK